MKKGKIFSLKQSPPCRNEKRTAFSVYIQITNPPLTPKTCPVMKSAFSEAKNNSARETSSGVPSRPSGVSSAKARISSPLKWAFISVAITPGATQLTWTPERPTSFASAFVIPTGMFLSFSAEGKTYSRIMRIRGSSLNLERINRVNDISRRCVRQPMPCEEIMAELMQIREVRNYRPKTVTLAGGFIAMCFTPFFGGSLSDALAAFPIGMATQFLVQKCEQLQINFIVRIISTSVILTSAALFLHQLGIIRNTDSVIIGSLMLLVPGLAITNAVRDSIGGDLLAGIIRAIEACLIAVAIALGAGVTMSIWLSVSGGA